MRSSQMWLTNRMFISYCICRLLVQCHVARSLLRVVGTCPPSHFDNQEWMRNTQLTQEVWVGGWVHSDRYLTRPPHNFGNTAADTSGLANWQNNAMKEQLTRGWRWTHIFNTNHTCRQSTRVSTTNECIIENSRSFKIFGPDKVLCYFLVFM